MNIRFAWRITLFLAGLLNVAAFAQTPRIETRKESERKRLEDLFQNNPAIAATEKGRVVPDTLGKKIDDYYRRSSINSAKTELVIQSLDSSFTLPHDGGPIGGKDYISYNRDWILPAIEIIDQMEATNQPKKAVINAIKDGLEKGSIKPNTKYANAESIYAIITYLRSWFTGKWPEVSANVAVYRELAETKKNLSSENQSLHWAASEAEYMRTHAEELKRSADN